MSVLMRSIRRPVLVGAATLALIGLVQPSGRAGEPAEKGLPASTFAFLKIENAAKLREEFAASQLGQLIADPAMQPLKQDIRARIQDASTKVREKLGVSLKELLTLPQGTIYVALVPREKAGEGKPAFALLASADAGANDAKMAEVLSKVNAEAEKNGAKVGTETFKDLKLTTIGGNDGKDPLIWTKVGSVYHIASDAGVLKDHLSNSSGRTESLATNANYQGVAKGLGEKPQVSLFLDAARIVDLAVSSAPGGNAEQLKAQLQIAGLNGFKGLGGSFSFNRGDYDQVLKLFLYSPGPSQGLLKIFAMPPIDLRPQAWVPASVNSYQTFSWDLDTAWKAVTELAEANGFGGFIDQAQSGIGGPNGAFDFKKDVFGPLGSRVTTISDFKKPVTEKSQRYLFAVALDDEKAFQNTFNKILDLTKASPKKRDFQGTTLYDFDMPTLPNAGAGGPVLEGSISVTIAKGNLFISSAPAFLEQILRPGGAPLSESADFQTVARKFPQKNSVLSYDRTEEQARVVYDMVKNGGLQKAIDQANANNPDAKAENPIDPKKIPDFSVFSKYLAPGGTYGIQDEQGLTITSFMLRKAQP